MARVDIGASDAPRDSRADINNNFQELYEGGHIHAATEKDAIADADEFGFLNSVASAFTYVKITWEKLKIAIRGMFDGVYYLENYDSLQDLIDEMAAADIGGTIVLPAGATSITETVTVPVGLRYLTFRGANKGNSTLDWNGDAGGTMLVIGDGTAASEPNYVNFENMRLSGSYLAKYLVDTYAGRAYFQNCRLDSVASGACVHFQQNVYYVLFNNVEFRNDGAHNSSAIEAVAGGGGANVWTFNNVTMSLFEVYGYNLLGNFNSVNIIGGAYEHIAGAMFHSAVGGAGLKINGCYIEDVASGGGAIIDCDARIFSMSVGDLYVNSTDADYLVSIVDTDLELGSIYAIAGLTAIVEMDADSHLIEKGRIAGGNVSVNSNGGVVKPIGNGQLSEYVSNGYGNAKTITKGGGTYAYTLEAYYEPLLIEVSLTGRFGAASAGCAKIWRVFCYIQSDGASITDGDVNDVDSLGDALVSNIALAVASTGADYKITLTLTNNYATIDFTLYSIAFKILRYRKDGDLIKIVGA